MEKGKAAGKRRPVVVVTGPTASGKTRAAIEICEAFGGEVINADSVQVYRFMDIGTAKPSREERARVPHHLIDVVDPDEAYSAGRYARAARDAALAIHGRGRVAVVSGGTGLYICSLLDGLIDVGGAEPGLREALEAEHREAHEAGDPGLLHRRLRELDPEAAARIHPHDARRVVRALEIRVTAGTAASELRDRHGFSDRPYEVLHLALDPPKEELERRIAVRCQAMIDTGLIREVRNMRRRGYGPELRSMKAIGYRHMNPVVDGSDTLANALEAMQRDTRRFAKRQRTWLRAVPEVVYVDPEDRSGIHRRVEAFLAANASER